ncbi:MAG: sugar ABC transporter permease [Actinomycetota bacterium]
MSTRRSARVREAALGYALVVPALLLVTVFILYPFFKNFSLFLYHAPPYPGLPSKWAGLSQMWETVSSTSFQQGLEATLLYTVLVVPIGVFLGLVFAVAAHQKLKGMAIYRTIFATTAVSSVAVAAVVFGTFMNPVFGLLPWLGIDPNPSVLQNPTWAMVAMAVIGLWQFVGLSFILFSAGLQSLPEEVLEAAKIDGAGAVRSFFQITVPLLSPTIFYVFTVGTIAAMFTFGQMDLLVGPGGASFVRVNTLAYQIYQYAVTTPNPGVAACISIALFILTATITFLNFRFLERRVNYAT